MEAAGSEAPGVGERVGVTVIALLILVAVLANLSGVLVILRCSHLRHSLPNFFVLSLCVADLAAATLVLPPAAASFYLQHWRLGRALCSAAGFLTSLLTFASIASLCVISMERFYSIRLPMHHAANMTLAKTLLVIAVIWLHSALFAGLPLVGVNSYEFRPHKRLCSFTWDGGGSHRVYAVLVAAWCFLLPAAILMLMYCGIYRVAHQSATQIRPEPTPSMECVPSPTPGSGGCSRPTLLTRLTLHTECTPLGRPPSRDCQSRDCLGERGGPSPPPGSQGTPPGSLQAEESQEGGKAHSAAATPNGGGVHAGLSAPATPATPPPGVPAAPVPPAPAPPSSPPSKAARSLSKASSWSEGNRSAPTHLPDLLEAEGLSEGTDLLPCENNLFADSPLNARKNLAAQKVLPPLSGSSEGFSNASSPFPSLSCPTRPPKVLPPLPSHLIGLRSSHSRSLPSLRHVRTSPRPKRKRSKTPSRHDSRLSQDSSVDSESLARQDSCAQEPHCGQESPDGVHDLPSQQLPGETAPLPHPSCQVQSQVNGDQMKEEKGAGCPQVATPYTVEQSIGVKENAQIPELGIKSSQTATYEKSPGHKISHSQQLPACVDSCVESTLTSNPQAKEAFQSPGCHTDCTRVPPENARPGSSSTLHHSLAMSSGDAACQTTYTLDGLRPFSTTTHKAELKTSRVLTSEDTSAHSQSKTRHRLQIRVNHVPAVRNPFSSGSSSSASSSCSRRARRPRRGQPPLRRSRLHLKAISNLVAVLAAFLLLWGPYFLLHLHAVIAGDVRARDVTELVVTWFGFSSFAVNPFLYCWMNRAIRAELLARGWTLFCCRRRKEGEGEERGESGENAGPVEGEDFFQFLERTSTTPAARPSQAESGRQAPHRSPGTEQPSSSTWF